MNWIMKIIKKKNILLLSPKEVYNEINKQYIKKIEDLLKDKRCKNIALVGNYGTGKSSIITTFFKRKKTYRNKSLIITIGSYIVDDDINKDGDDNKISTAEQKLVNRVEESILKQIIYRDKTSKFPKSSLIRYDKESFIKKLLITIGILYILWFAIYFSYKYYNNSILSIEKLYNFFGINGYIFLILSSLIIYEIIHYYINKVKINKIKIKDCELELNQDTNSLFSRYLTEIVYYFQITKCKLIVFEDLDRFPPDIALKVIQELKELNTILNTSKNIKKIVFIYAIKDDLFDKMEDKNKFYDYNLSILPISTSFNSELNLIGIMKEQNIYDELNTKLISIISKYIYDMRTLINIVNDYVLFKKINKTKNYDKLLSMVVLKNYYYKNYEKIFYDNKDNIIKNAFNTCEEKRKKLIYELEKQKEDINLDIKNAYNELARNRKELKELLIAENIYENNNSLYLIKYYVINGSQSFPIQDFLNDDFNINILKDSNFSFKNSGNYLISEEEVFKKFSSKEKFLERYNNVLNKELIKKLEGKREDINKTIENINKLNVNEIFRKYYDDIKGLLVEDNNSLLYELIKDNFLCEDYLDYITAPVIFETENKFESLLYSDSKFLMDVRQERYSFETRLNGFETIIQVLKDEFDTSYILNYDLLNYLISYNKNEYIDKIIMQFNEMDKIKFKFIYSFLLKYPEKVNYVLNMFETKKIDIWKYFLEYRSDYTYEDFIIIILDILKDEKYINCIQDVGTLRKAIEEDLILNEKDYNWLLEQETVRSNIIKIKPRFKNILIFNDINYEFIYKNNLYSFSPENLNLITLNKDIDVKDLQSNQEYQLLYQYIKDNLIMYCNEYYINSSGRISIQELINKIIYEETFDDKVKKEVFRREKFKLKDIIGIKKEYYLYLLMYNHINISWKNIIDLYNETERIILFEFVTKNINKLINKNIMKENIIKTNMFFKDYIMYIIQKDLIIADKLIKINKPVYESINGLEGEQIKLLIKNECISINKNNYNYIYDYLNLEERNQYILQGINELANPTEIIKMFSIEDIEFALCNSEFKNDKKIEILYAIYKKEKRNINEVKAFEKFISRLRKTFVNNKIYKITYNKTIYNAILIKVKRNGIFKKFEIKEKTIEFIL